MENSTGELRFFSNHFVKPIERIVKRQVWDMRNVGKNFGKGSKILSMLLVLALLLSNATLLYSVPAEASSVESEEDLGTLGSEETEDSQTDEISEEQTQEETENEELTAEEPEDTTEVSEDDGQNMETVITDEASLTYEDDQVVVQVSAQEGVIPEGASLSIRPITEESNAQEYQNVADQLNAQAEESMGEVQGFLAYDISLVDAQGNEVEPSGQVEVSMDYKTAAAPAGIDTEDGSNMDVTVMHLEEDDQGNVKSVTDVGEAEQITNLATNDSQQVEQVTFVTESFSTFTITWRSTGIEVTVHYVYEDENGNYQDLAVNAKDIRLNSNQSVTLEERAQEVDGYEYDRAVMNPRNTNNRLSGGTEIQKLRVQEEKIGWWSNYYLQYQRSGSNRWQDWQLYEYDVYFVYNEIDSLHTVDTVDSQSDGITMRMIDYGTAADGLDDAIGGGYGEGNVKQGLLESVLDDGYPRTESGWGQSLERLFSGGTEVNHLFLQETYDSTGYYEYSSFENYAYLNDNGNFTVYEEIGTPENSDAYYFQRGNFMPYNQIVAGKFSDNRNLYDEDGNELDSSDPRYNERLYKTQGDNNFYFGMYLEANFLQMRDGTVTHNGVESDMIYEFNGDDDLWVFIDDVLVLDIGGIHDAHSGYINFATGEVHVELGDGDTQNTTIKAMFEEALNDNGGRITLSNGTELTRANINDYFDGDTFRDYSAHNIKMFYMERGAGASNLHMKFNLPTIPEGQITVAKDLTNTDKDRYANVEFSFQLNAQKITGTDSDGNESYSSEFVPVSGEEYVLLNENNEEIGSGVTGADGDFILKPGQRAQFNLQSNRQYYVVETGVSSDEYDEVIINDTVIEVEDPDGGTSTIRDIESTKETVGNRPLVTFINSCSTKNQRELRITKKLAGNLKSSDTFSFKIQLEGTDGEMTAYVGDYYLRDGSGNYYYYDNSGNLVSNEQTAVVCGKTDENGIVSGIPADYTVSITQILSETDFLVEEVNLNTDKYRADYGKELKEGSYGASDKGDGQILLGTDAEMTITNYPYQSITAEKTWSDGADKHTGDQIYVGLYRIAEDDLIPVEGKTLLLNAENQWQAAFAQLDPDTYTIRELRTVQDGETAEFTIDGQGYIQVEEGGMITVGDSNYQADYGEMTSEDEENTIDSSIAVTNTLMTKLSVTKVWDDSGKELDHSGQAIVDGLFQNEAFVEGSLQTLDSSNEWSYTYSVNDSSTEGYTVKELVAVEEEQEGCITVTGESGTSYYMPVENGKYLRIDGNIYQAAYETGNDAVTITNTLQLGSIEITKKNDDGELLENAIFRLTDAQGNQVGEDLTTGENGMVTFENLLPGEYTITEIQSPEGYTLLANPVKVTVGTTEGDSDNGYTVVGDKNTYYYQLKLDVVNQDLFTMPEAGNHGIQGMMLAGAFLMLAGGGYGVYLAVRRKRLRIKK